MSELQKGLELVGPDTELLQAFDLKVEILQWHNNNPFFGDYMNKDHFERELKKMGSVELDTVKIKQQAVVVKEIIKPVPTAKDNQVSQKLLMKRRKQLMQRSLDMWEQRQGDRESAVPVPNMELTPDITALIIESKVVSKPQKLIEDENVNVLTLELIVNDSSPENEPINKEIVKKSVFQMIANGKSNQTKLRMLVSQNLKSEKRLTLWGAMKKVIRRMCSRSTETSSVTT